MYLVLALVMGYLTATNAWVETQVRQDIGAAYANPTLAKLSSFGGLASWFCIIPAAYFYSVSDFDTNFWDALLFCACAFIGGTLIATLIRSQSLRYLVSPFALIINPALVFLTYWMSTQ